MNAKIDISPDQLKTVKAILRAHLPTGAHCWAFGSRVTWTAKPFSDLDLAVEGNGPLSTEVMADLAEAFEESDLPWRVGVIDLNAVSDEFREIVEARRMPLHTPKFGECVDIVMGQSPRGVFVNKTGNGLPLLNGPTEFGPNHPFPTQFTDKGVRFAEPGDLLFCVRGSTTGRMNWADQRYAIGRGIAAIRHASDRRLQPLVQGLVEGQLPKLLAAATGSTFPNVTGKMIASLNYSELGKDEQLEVAITLGQFDDKIELNRRMSETLEEMARALFRDWFVDFGPTRRQMEGATDPTTIMGHAFPPEKTATLAPLFPVKLGDDGLPKGWLNGTLGDVATQCGESVRPDALEPATPYIGLEHMPRRSIALSEWASAGKVRSGKLSFRRGDFLFGKVRPYFHKVGIAPVDGICSTDIVVLNAREQNGASFVLACISQDEFVTFTDRTSDGTKMPRTSWGRMEEYGICLPSGATLKAFNGFVEPMLDRIVANIHESRTLAALRDLLLPKLMSGEVRVREVEKHVREAT